MLNNVIKNLSILKKFLFINFLFFLVIGILTIFYLKNVQPNLIKKKSANHINVINNTIDNILRLDVNLNKRDIQKFFLTSTRFLFQNLDRVIFFDNELNLIGDTDTLDLDPRAFSQRLNIIEFEVLSEEKTKEIVEKKNININKKNSISLKDVLFIYIDSRNFGKPYTFSEETYEQFKLTTIKNINKDGKMLGMLQLQKMLMMLELQYKKEKHLSYEQQ